MTHFVTDNWDMTLTNTSDSKEMSDVLFDSEDGWFFQVYEEIVTFISGGSRPWAKEGPRFFLHALPSFLPSVITSFFTQNKGGGGNGPPGPLP